MMPRFKCRNSEEEKSSLHFSLHQSAHRIFHLLPCWIFSRLMWASATWKPDGSFLESALFSFNSLFTKAAQKRMLQVGSAGEKARIRFLRRWESQVLSRNKDKWESKVSVGILNSLSLGKGALFQNISGPRFCVYLSCVSSYSLADRGWWVGQCCAVSQRWVFAKDFESISLFHGEHLKMGQLGYWFLVAKRK